jgi:hypothetical protein
MFFTPIRKEDAISQKASAAALYPVKLGKIEANFSLSGHFFLYPVAIDGPAWPKIATAGEVTAR